MKCSLDKIRKRLEKQKYALFGKSSGTQICLWTKNSLNKKGVCWKQKFYGIESHRCCQFSPAVMWCENTCLHCWRPIEMNLGSHINEKEIDEPKKILDGIVEARKKLLMGFKGNKNVSEKMFNEACEPSLFTLSLSGEPTIYPRLPELIREIRKRKAISFLVTNGLNPEMLSKLDEEKSLPTQITVSCNAPNEKLFRVWHNSTKKNAWKKFNESLDVLKNLRGKTRRVFRMTLVKRGDGKSSDLTNMADENVAEYVSLIRKTNPDFIHVKGFKSVGFARERFGYDKQPWFYEVKKYAEELLKEMEKFSETKGYKILGEDKRSCVVLLGKDKRKMKIRERDI